MRTITRSFTGAALIFAATVFAAPMAFGQSCTGGKLCNGNYKTEYYGSTNPDHSDIMIVVAGVGGANPHFIFAPNKTDEKFTCNKPHISGGGETMTCSAPLEQATEEGNMEIVTVGVIGGAFCETLRNSGGGGTKVISPADCDKDDCACFAVDYFWGTSSTTAEESASIVFGPPSRGTGSGGSP